MEENRKKVEKFRNFTFLLYPDSEDYVVDWEDKINELHIKSCSILHDRDDKKAHYHVVVMFNGPRAVDGVIRYLEEIKPANGQIKPVKELKGMMRYICHLDETDKFMYNLEEVKCYGEFEYIDYIEKNSKKDVVSKNMLLREMLRFVVDNQIEHYVDFSTYCSENNIEWFNELQKSGAGRVIYASIKSLSHKLREERFGLNNRRY